MDKVNSIIDILKLPAPKGEKWSTRNAKRIEKVSLRIPKHIDTFIEKIKKKDEDAELDNVPTLYNIKSLEQYCEDKYVIALIVMMVWLDSPMNENEQTGDVAFHWQDEDTDELNYSQIKDCYDLHIIKVIDQFYPQTFKDNSGNNNVIAYDMRIKETKFDYVYDSIFSGCDKSVLKNKYQHKSQLKKKFLTKGETYDNGKIDYQLVMFNRIFDLEMRNSN